MAAPILPIIKKVAVAVLTDKRFWQIIGAIIVAVLLLAVMPVLVLGGMLAGLEGVDDDQIQGIVKEYEQQHEEVLHDIDEAMASAGFEDRTEEAKAVYLLVLYDYGEEEDFVVRLIGCFADGQTDEQLIAAVNAEFGTAMSDAEFTVMMQDVRNAQQKEEEEGGIG